MSDRERNRRRMAGLLEQWQAGGETLSAFARAQRIGRDKLEYWRRRLAKPLSEPPRRKIRPRRTAVAFAPIHLAATTAPVVITLPDGVRVAISDGVREELVRTVVAALRRAC